mgnify:CR=1 FL=1
MPLKNKLDSWLVVKTATTWMAILYVVCLAAYLIVPAGSFDILWKPMIHAFNLTPVLPYVVLGFLEAVIYTIAAVWLFVTLYNQFAKR